mmetsp:Transcript_2209/g.3348  ORF Transcript_2209/g.3348 Transcript_2209/m.3348 type:complete len:86 (-) Transcript_2209:2067-2324(-)
MCLYSLKAFLKTLDILFLKAFLKTSFSTLSSIFDAFTTRHESLGDPPLRPPSEISFGWPLHERSIMICQRRGDMSMQLPSHCINN